MSQDKENKQCQICHGYLFDDDDVVVCPVCGAPHHKDCWEAVGHCGMEEYHGTEKQYQPSSAQPQREEHRQRCPACGRESKSSDTQFCPYCGHSFDGGRPHIFSSAIPDPFDTISNIKEIEGVKTEEIEKFVGAAAPRYLPRFAAMTKRRHGSWNWAAFLFPSAWCLSRKMYANGILYLIISIAAKLCFIPFLQTAAALGDTSSMTREQIYRLISNNIGAFSLLSVLMCLAGFLLTVIPRLICGRNGDWSYRNFTLNKIRSIHENFDSDEQEDELRRAGSVSILLMFAALLADVYLPSILEMFIW